LRGGVWSSWDFKLLDHYVKKAVAEGHGPKNSDRIIYIASSDASYEAMGAKVFDRSLLADVNDSLSDFGTAATVYDIIFNRPSDPEKDRVFIDSIRSADCVFMPVGLQYQEKSKRFQWGKGAASEQLRKASQDPPAENGPGRPFQAVRALLQLDDLAGVSCGTGHISAHTDSDGVYRHMLLLIRIDNGSLPVLPLSVFLKWAKVPFKRLTIHWGKEIRIPALPGSRLKTDRIIPIDHRGRAYVPLTERWAKDFPKVELFQLLEYLKDDSLQGNLAELFENRFVFIGDVSSGVSDLGQTPLDRDVPMITQHAAMLNALLTGSFYRKWSTPATLALVALFAAILGLAGCFKNRWIVYGCGLAAFPLLGWSAWVLVIRFTLFPVAATAGSFLILFSGAIAVMHAAVAKERAFIKNAFSHYVPPQVVQQIIETPDMLKLGGQKREISILFSDLADFTTLSENMDPVNLVSLLNDYLTEMTDTILAEGGIVDKYLGDAIMAEFGMPAVLADHADRAVSAALGMQLKMTELRRQRTTPGWSGLFCRIGVNTGPVVVGNLGSREVFDYTVIGDAANLASRLEGINKLYGTGLMISEATYRQLSSERFLIRPVDVVKVKGKKRAVRVYEVYGDGDRQPEADAQRYYDAYTQGFSAYLSRDFPEAAQQFRAALKFRAGDPAAEQMCRRAAELNHRELPEDWDGAITLKTK